MTADEPRTLPELLDAWEAAMREYQLLRNGGAATFDLAETQACLVGSLAYRIEATLVGRSTLAVKHRGRVYILNFAQGLCSIDPAEIPEAAGIEVVR